MRYRLKDRELQKKLDEITGGDFSKQLGGARNRHLYGGTLCVKFGKELGRAARDLEHRVFRFEAFFEDTELEEIPSLPYDPTAWNSWPEVDPPEDVWLRVDVPNGGFKAKAKHSGSGDVAFYTPDREEITDDVIRFRPWDDL